MTAISSSISMGRQMMDARIARAVSSGTVSSDDQAAFKTALDSIDSAMSSSTSAGGDIKGKIDDLIDQQVSAGTLTEDQASELQDLFAAGPGGPPPPEGMESAEGSDGASAMRGPPPPPPPSDSDDSSTSTDGTTSTEDAKQQALEALLAFLENLKSSLSSSTYGSSASGSSSTTGVVVDKAA